MIRKLAIVLVLFGALFSSLSCGGETGIGANVLAYVLINPGQLGSVNLLSGSAVGGPVGLSALIRDIAVRPTDGQLFGIGSDLKLYSINPVTGGCTAVTGVALAIDDHNGGMTFAPGTNIIRFISVNGSNYRINSSTGLLIGTDTTANANVIGLAARSTDGRYFAYTTGDTLVSALDPTSGVFNNVGPSGVNSSGAAGLAIANGLGMVYFVANEGLFSVSLNTGAITLMDPTPYMDIAVALL